MINFNINLTNVSKPFFGLEFPIELTESYSPVLKDYWADKIYSPKKWFLSVQDNALKSGADFVSVYFNSCEPDNSVKHSILEKYKNLFSYVLAESKLPIMLKLSSHAPWDCEILKAIAPIIDRELIIAPILAANYNELLNTVLKNNFNHKFVLRTPIDINLTKELNILSIDSGIIAQQILIDPDMGCIGYGIDYGYSIIERICLARKSGDKMLDMPIIAFVGEEAYKAKESKSTDFTASWGELSNRAIMWEISSASALIAAGANVIVCWHPIALETLKRQFCEVTCH